MIKVYKVYGINGHRQRAAFYDDFTVVDERGSYTFFGHKSTGTYEYAFVVIISDSEEKADALFYAQLYDGAFENCRVGRIIEEKVKEL